MSDRVGGWIWTISGKRFWPRDPRVEDFCIADIAHGCAREPRFAGQTRVTYSVAEHCVRVSLEVERRLRDPERNAIAAFNDVFNLAPADGTRRIILASLIHDGAEGLGWKDMPSPVKYDKDEPAWMADYRAGEKHCQSVLFDWAGIGAERHHPLIKEVDLILRATEQRDLCLPIPEEFLESKVRPEPLPERIVPWGETVAEMRFLSRWAELRR